MVVKPAGFHALDAASAKDYIVSKPVLQEIVGPVESTGEWNIRETGDGNINFVYIVEGPAGSLVMKQALPFVRCVGESWPLTLVGGGARLASFFISFFLCSFSVICWVWYLSCDQPCEGGWSIGSFLSHSAEGQICGLFVAVCEIHAKVKRNGTLNIENEN